MGEDAGAAPLLVDVGGFDRVESSGAAGDDVTWMAHQRRFGADGAIDGLAVGPGDRVLDLGCGPGADLAALAPRVVSAGLAVGLDRSAAGAGAARTAAPGASVVVGDGQGLPFASGSFAGAWARAVLIHTPAPDAAVAELAPSCAPAGTWCSPSPTTGPAWWPPTRSTSSSGSATTAGPPSATR